MLTAVSLFLENALSPISNRVSGKLIAERFASANADAPMLTTWKPSISAGIAISDGQLPTHPRMVATSFAIEYLNTVTILTGKPPQESPHPEAFE